MNDFKRRVEDKLEDEELEKSQELPLHVKPVTVTRFNRKTVGMLLAIVAIVTAFSLTYSLSPRKKTSEEVRKEVVRRGEELPLPTPPESVTAAPNNYEEAQRKPLPPGVPQLPNLQVTTKGGPSLTPRTRPQGQGLPAAHAVIPPAATAPGTAPGVLQEAEPPTYVPAPVGATPPATAPVAPPVSAEGQRAAAETESRQKELQDARKSPVEFSAGKEPDAKNPPSLSMPQIQPQVATPQTQQPPPDDQNMQEEKRRFLNQKKEEIYVKTELVAPVSPYEIKAGTIFPATLLTGINSDLPGQITAQVSENVYDTVTGRFLLIPQGTRIVGEYDSKVAYGQERVLVVWHRLILPNGNSIALEGMPGVDLSGYSGLKDKVNNHYFKLITGVVLGSIIGASAQVATGGQGSPNTPSSFGQQAVSGAAQNLNQAGQAITQKNLNVQPTVEIRPGVNVNVFTTKDLILEPYQ